MENYANVNNAYLNNPAPEYPVYSNPPWYPMEPCCYAPVMPCGSGFNFTLIVVLFILLIIVGASMVY